MITIPLAAIHRGITRALMCVMILPAIAAAQRASGTISGFVHDSAGVGIPGVLATVDSTEISARTDDGGEFTLRSVPVGAVTISLRRVGFKRTDLPVTVVANRNPSIDVTLQPLTQDLAAVVVTEDEARQRTWVKEFYERRKIGLGTFITREEIEQRNPGLMSEMFRTLPGVQLVRSSRLGGQSVIRFARTTSTRDCPPQFYVDGVSVDGMNIDDMYPQDVEGVEVYRGPAVIPVQFKKQLGNSICGVIAIWTRLPGT